MCMQNRKNTPERLELQKYNPNLSESTAHAHTLCVRLSAYVHGFSAARMCPLLIYPLTFREIYSSPRDQVNFRLLYGTR